jgi:hypothetical protein
MAHINALRLDLLPDDERFVTSRLAALRTVAMSDSGPEQIHKIGISSLRSANAQVSF